jgi:hypothetical protein
MVLVHYADTAIYCMWNVKREMLQSPDKTRQTGYLQETAIDKWLKSRGFSMSYNI